MNQDLVEPGHDYWYRLHFPDAGVFWYHPHVREDIQQGLGLFGNIFVEPSGSRVLSPVNREAFVMLQDLLVVGTHLSLSARTRPTLRSWVGSETSYLSMVSRTTGSLFMPARLFGSFSRMSQTHELTTSRSVAPPSSLSARTKATTSERCS